MSRNDQSVNQNDNVPTDVTVKTSDSSDSETNVKDGKVTYTSQSDSKTSVNGTWSEAADEHVRKLINDAQTAREAIEEHRADRRNRNRLLTLAFAIIIGIIVTYFFQHDGLPILGWHNALPKTTATMLYGYSFVVTVTLDASLALYAYIKKF